MTRCGNYIKTTYPTISCSITPISTICIYCSISVAPNSPDAWRVFAPGDNPDGGSGSVRTSYNATEFAINHTTHSDFSPYVTTVGLYNDNNDLLAIGKLGRPIKRDKDEAFSIVVRFDV